MLRGILVPLITPIQANGLVCGDSVARLIDHVGICADGFVPCLTTGEGWRLTDAQWCDMVQSTLRHAGGRPVVAGIEERTTTQAAARIRKAAELGCTAVIAAKPFGTAVTQDEILAHFRFLADVADVDLLAYNESWLTGNVASQPTLSALTTISRLVAIKESTGIAPTTRWMAEHRSELPALFQGAESLLQMSEEFDGFIVAAANLLPTLCHDLYSALDVGQFRKFKALCQSYGLLSDNWIARIKAELHMQGVLSTPALIGSGGEALGRGAWSPLCASRAP